MTIPRFNKFGYLPVGVHNCTLREIERSFGSFQSTDYRVRLFRQLEKFVVEVQDTGYVSVLVINGSFVTRSPNPNEIDLILGLGKDFSFDEELPPSTYNVLSRRKVKSRYGFDVFVDRVDSTAYKEHIAFFQRVRDLPRRRKGCLRLKL